MTRKLKDRGLNLGTATDQISAKTFLAGFSPANLTPVQVGTEGTDKVSSFLKGVDNKFGVAKYVDQFFAGGTTPLTISTTFLAGTLIDVYFSGVLMEETTDWTRDAVLNQIALVSNETISQTRIRVRIWN